MISNFIKICDELKELLTTPENKIKYVFPQPSKEEGIQIIFYNLTYIKTIILKSCNTHKFVYDMKPIIYYQSIYLKALDNAPLWTLNELKIVKEVFEKYNIPIKSLPETQEFITLN